ncbi:PREDICTED: serine/threonine-protein kinase VRK1-like [Vollenhovia emeryi]|uniref:serine/threonine-protein kinase VRK1-like n=1 Tax=Vollenhovia emeryi TaxID=411798 RepID=UPI0005F441FF|nr:PREDICTED: serine/threonine-protein kinase VRK1-like [Vollenhovia emeryi]XP_011872508.1 PREDICTED: serine/threonine-protein kinase VRK1-like [Vollenhovia emeryi]
MAAKAAKAAKRVPKKKGGYQMPEPIPAGEILMDLSKSRWILGKSIGVGGFGEVYSAAPYSGNIPKEYNNVIKIEPHVNGPLFVEMHFYMRNCKPDDIDDWQKKKKLAALGVPRYVASGSHEYKNTKYRFLVIDRYGKDLWKIFEENNRQFPEHVVYKLALQIIDILEYIHHKNYVHADVKGENLLLDLKSYDQVYLVDFGLASRCTSSTELKVDPKKAHNGTLQYTSRDAHMGVPTRRSDIEILSYNIIMWLCGSLPWENLLDPPTVQKEKEKAFNNMDSFLDKCFQGSVPQAVHKFMTLVASLKFNEIPSYEKLKEVLIAGLKKLNHKPDGKLQLNNIGMATAPKKTTQRMKKPANGVRSSPRTKRTDVPSSENEKSRLKKSRQSTIGVVIDKKRCNLKEIEKVLDDMDSDEEYDIQILKKAKKTEATEKASKITTAPSRKKKIPIQDDSDDDSNIQSSNRSNKTQRKKPTKSTITRKPKSLDDSETTAEAEIISKGTKSRPAATAVRNKVSTKSRLQSNKVIPTTETESDEEMF